MTRLRTAAALLASAAGISQCAMAQPPAAGCTEAEQRQFDFWIGHWDVFTPDGKLAGENLIERIAGGCALLENWRGAGGFSGKSLNSWDRQAQRWRQHWVDSSGSLLRLEGGLNGPQMVLAGRAQHPRRPESMVHDRISWTPQPDGSIRQLWERSEDGQRSWSTVFDGRYVKRR
jgi:hypothetical protein